MRHRCFRPILTVVVALVAVGSLSGVASGGSGTWQAAPLTGTPTSPTAVAVSGTGCVGNNVLVILSEGSNVNQLPGVVNQQIVPDGGGNWNGVLNVPAGLTPGEYTLWAQCVVQFNYPNLAFQIAVPVPPDVPVVPDALVAPVTFTG